MKAAGMPNLPNTQWPMSKKPISTSWLFLDLCPMTKNKTLVIGASPNPSRYSHLAIERLTGKGHEVEGIGKQEFQFRHITMGREKKDWPDIDTVTMYINPTHQKEYYTYILSLHPRRIIFNPGTENPELAELARKAGILAVEACTLVMLSTNQY
jgi:predicted CoA-binding protein